MYLLGILIICLTVVFCVVYLTQWTTYMSRKQLPHFTVGNLVPKQDAPAEKTAPIGFIEPTTVAEQPEEKLSDKEKAEAVLKDTASTISALLRGEVDFDELNGN